MDDTAQGSGNRQHGCSNLLDIEQSGAAKDAFTVT